MSQAWPTVAAHSNDPLRFEVGATFEEGAVAMSDFFRGPINPRKYLARLFPLEIAQALQRAALRRDDRAIDRLTDDLVTLGFCRKRSDDSRFGLRGMEAGTHRHAAVSARVASLVGAVEHMEGA